MIEVPDKIEADAVVSEVLSQRTCRAKLPNGKLVFGFLSKATENSTLQPGACVRLRMDVADFSRGEIIALR